MDATMQPMRCTDGNAERQDDLPRARWPAFASKVFFTFGICIFILILILIIWVPLLIGLGGSSFFLSTLSPQILTVRILQAAWSSAVYTFLSCSRSSHLPPRSGSLLDGE